MAEQFAANSRKKYLENKEELQRRLKRLGSMQQTFRTFTKVARDASVEQRRFIEEHEQLLKRERAARAEAEATRERLHEVLESIGDAFFAVDGQWCFSYVNDRAVRLAGRPRQELLGKRVSEVFPELVEDEASTELSQAEEKSSVTEFARYSPRLDRWLHHRVYRSRSGLSVYITDITEQKEAEEALRKSEERLQQAIEIETVGVIFFDTKGAITEANEAFLRMSGFSRADVAEGRVRWDEMTPAEHMPVSMRAIEELNATGRTTPYEKEYIRKDGSRWWGLFAAKLLDGDEGVEYVIDVTERKRAEEALQYQLDLTRTITNNAADSLFLWDTEGRVTFMNPAAEQTFGWKQEELLGEVLHDFVHHHYPDGRPYPVSECPLVRVAESGQTLRDHEDLFFHRDGTPIDVACSLAPIVVDEKITGAVLVVRDTTERKRAEEERERSLSRELELRAQAEERRRISRELHDRVAHTIAVVHQSLELHEALKEHQPAMAEAKMELARKTAKEALTITRNLSTELRRPEIRRTLEAALADLLRTIVPPTVRYQLGVEGDEALIPPHARNQLFLILREAVRNAVSHSECGGISVRVDVIAEKVTGTIEDDGRGFDPEASAEGGGLRSIKERAALAGGACNVRSQPNAGTRVQVSIPLTPEP